MDPYPHDSAVVDNTVGLTDNLTLANAAKS